MSYTLTALRLTQKTAIRSIRATAPAAQVFSRSLHTPYNYSSPAKPASLWEGLWNCDGTNLHEKIFHYSQLTLAVVTPLAFVLPNAWCLPLDYVLAILYPMHGCIGMSHIYSDYWPKGWQKGFRIGTTLLTLVAILGLLYYNTKSKGVTEAIKSFWRPAVPKKINNDLE
ncbi:hypothetical protein WA158_007755 [Blastocystis sp. Blastoise]